MPNAQPSAPAEEPLLAQISALTDDIEHAVRMSDWNEAARLALLRSPLIYALKAEHAETGLPVIRRVQAVDARVLAEASANRHELQAEYSGAMKRLNSAKQYQQMARL